MSPAARRKFRLFPRTLDEVVKHATQPLMHKQGKLYSALLRDWEQIVGATNAARSKPERLQFPAKDATGATLHLAVRPAAAPEFAYLTEQLLEQCARYFGYRAIVRVVVHPTHGMGEITEPALPPRPPQRDKIAPLPSSVPTEMQAVLERLARHVASTVVKKNETR